MGACNLLKNSNSKNIGRFDALTSTTKTSLKNNFKELQLYENSMNLY